MNGEQNDKNRRMRPEKILEMFLEVVKQNASKSYDFPISDVSGVYCYLFSQFSVADCGRFVYARERSLRPRFSVFNSTDAE